MYDHSNRMTTLTENLVYIKKEPLIGTVGLHFASYISNRDHINWLILSGFEGHTGLWSVYLSKAGFHIG